MLTSYKEKHATLLLLGFGAQIKDILYSYHKLEN